jgi:hypothetical protein
MTDEEEKAKLDKILARTDVAADKAELAQRLNDRCLRLCNVGLFLSRGGLLIFLAAAVTLIIGNRTLNLATKEAADAGGELIELYAEDGHDSNSDRGRS